jgi:hypothetical protein
VTCLQPAMRNRRRCRLHGGKSKSTGSRTPGRPRAESAGELEALKIEQLEEDDRAGIVSLKVVTKNKGEGEGEYVAEVRTDKLGALTLLARHLGIDKLTVADDRLDLTKLSTETLDRIKTELGL